MSVEFRYQIHVGTRSVISARYRPMQAQMHNPGSLKLGLMLPQFGDDAMPVHKQTLPQITIQIQYSPQPLAFWEVSSVPRGIIYTVRFRLCH